VFFVYIIGDTCGMNIRFLNKNTPAQLHTDRLPTSKPEAPLGLNAEFIAHLRHAVYRKKARYRVACILLIIIAVLLLYTVIKLWVS
jgi:hypothetical protein